MDVVSVKADEKVKLVMRYDTCVVVTVCDSVLICTVEEQTKCIKLTEFFGVGQVVIGESKEGDRDGCPPLGTFFFPISCSFWMKWLKVTTL